MDRRLNQTHTASLLFGGGCVGFLVLLSIAAAQASPEAVSVLGEPTVDVGRVAPDATFDDLSLEEKPTTDRVRLAAREPRVFPSKVTKDRQPTDDHKEKKEAEGSQVEAPSSGPVLDSAKNNASEDDSAKEAEPKPTAEATDLPAKAKGAEPKEPPPPLSRSLRYLRSRMRTVLSYYYRKPMNTVHNTPWEIMHGMLAYELHSRVLDGGPRGAPMTAVGHLCFNRPSHRQQMMRLTEDNEIDVRIGVGLQGHLGQLLAMLAQCNVSAEYPVRVDGEEMKIRDLIASEQKTCYTKTELTFKLIGLGHYLASDAEWKNDRGETWDIPKLIREERNQPIRGAACGGTHRLAGLSLAYRRREARGEPIDGEYLEAARFVSQYQTMAFRLQNSDGSLSTEWFRGRGAEDDIERRVRTTGHLLEWLAYSLPDEQLRSPRMVRAASYLTNLLANNANFEWHPGSLGHALHALVVYDKRVFQPLDETGLAAGEPVDPTASRYRGYAIYRGVMRNTQQRPSGFFGMFGSSSASRPNGRRTR